jgi:outer membrane protein assembly factor BamB
MRKACIRFLGVAGALLLLGAVRAETLEKVITHEHPLFRPRDAHLTVGRDGKAYLSNLGTTAGRHFGFVLRLSRDGKDRFGTEVLLAFNATANKDGLLATASPGPGGHRLALYGPSYRLRGGVDDFEHDHNPGHVEAGTSRDFYGLDSHRRRVMRVSPAGKLVRAYALPDGSPKEARKRSYTDFRVCEKTSAFYLVTHPDPHARIVCVGFDGKERWAYTGRIHYGPVGVHRWVAAFDVDEDGLLHVLDEESVKKVGPDGKPAGEVKLRMGDARPGPGRPGYGYLRLCGDEVLLRRGHDSELFRRYDLKTGALKGTVSTDHERLTVTLDGGVWTAGRPVPVRIRLTAGERIVSPRWRAWARPFASLDYREWPIAKGAVQVPADAAGFYLVKITPEVRPWQRLAPADQMVRTVVEVRRPGTMGSATVLTPDNRTHYGRGEAVPFTVAVRGLEPDKAVALTVRLLDGTRTLAQGEARVKGSAEAVPFQLSRALTAQLVPGRYTLAVSAPGLSCASQPLVIGPGLARPSFHIVQYADYGLLYPGGARPGERADVWDAPDRTAAHAARTAKLGANLMVDRLGWMIDLHHHLAWSAEDRGAIDALRKRLETSGGGVAPRRVSMAPPLLQTQAAYSAAGIEQMAILAAMDAGLPLGKPHDQRKPADFTRDLTRVTEALRPYPSFRGWTWAANWWVSEEGHNPSLPRRSLDAKTAEERAAYIDAFRQAEKTGAWAPVLDKVAGYRLGYAVEAQRLFNTTFRKLAPDKVTAVAGPYRSINAYPPVTFANVDEVDLHYQAEQIQPPNTAPHNVDFQKRPGRRAWGHPELGNDAGTGDQILPTYFQMVMRGADGVGCSGAIPNWGPQPNDERSAYPGTTSVYRAAHNLLHQYGPWLTTLRNNDRVAIVVSGRMCHIDDWAGIGGRYFTRLFEAYQSCLHAHYPASFVFVEDLTPKTFARYKAVLVVGQTVEMEPALAAALARTRAAGTVLLHDDTCRKELVKGCAPLGIAFNNIEKDPSVWQDDSAYLRFPAYYRAHRPALTKALGAALPPVAEVSAPEVLLSERAGEEGRYLFVVNNTVPDIGPGQLWRVTLAMATRVPLRAPVKLRGPTAAVYDVFAMKRVTPKDGAVEADLRNLPARLYAILPSAIGRVKLRGPSKAQAGQALTWSVEVQDEDGQAIRASVPLRVRLLDSTGRVLEERFTAAGAKGASGTMRTVRNAAPGAQTLEATELLSGRTARLVIAVTAPAGPASLAAVEDQPPARADADGKGTDKARELAAAERLFGPHVRDLVVTGDGSLAVASAMNWDHNLYGVDAATGKVRWRQRAGHYFAFAPQALARGVAVQGYDLKSAEGYHLYLVGRDGKPKRRFALYGLPRRLPHRFLAGSFLGDRVNNFAVPTDGAWVATAGDLGLAVWSRDGKPLWSRDWWMTSRHTAVLAALGTDTLLAIEGTTATAYTARTGKVRWQVRLSRDGEAASAIGSPDGKTCAIRWSDGDRVFVLREGKVVTTIHGSASAKNLHHMSLTGRLAVTGLALSADGALLAVTAGNLLKLYSVADGLRWVMPADDVLHSPRFSADGKRIAAGSELGTLYVMSASGELLLERDVGALPVPAWLPDGDLLVGTWMGALCRLDKDYAERWRTLLRPAAPDMRGKLLAVVGAPTTRIAFRGNAEATAAPLTPNLLGPKKAFIKFVWVKSNGEVQNDVHFAHASAALMDGKADAPRVPWISWPHMNWYGEGSPSSYLWIDTYRTQLRVTGITLVEDPAHPESWLRDATFEYWDAATGRWAHVQPLLSNAAIHTHKFARPVEAARFRILLPKMLCSNLRLGEIVLHGEELGTSHPDVVARRPVAVLFDEGDDLAGYLYHGKVALTGAYSGTRCLTVQAGADAYSFAPWLEGSTAFGHTLPNWDFEIVERPRAGQYRYLQFAWKALGPTTKGIALRLDNGAHDAVTVLAGDRPPGEIVTNARKVADRAPREWTVVRIDLWEVFKRPVRIRGMRLGSAGGPAAFDQVLLGRTEKDLPPVKKAAPAKKGPSRGGT